MCSYPVEMQQVPPEDKMSREKYDFRLKDKHFLSLTTTLLLSEAASVADFSGKVWMLLPFLKCMFSFSPFVHIYPNSLIRCLFNIFHLIYSEASFKMTINFFFSVFQ